MSENAEEKNQIDAYLSPVWFVQYYCRGDENYTTDIYLAETGELLDSSK